MSLTPGEKEYLKALRAMKREGESFTHRAMCKRFGWRSLNSSWGLMRQLEAKGYNFDVIRVVHASRAA